MKHARVIWIIFLMLGSLSFWPFFFLFFGALPVKENGPLVPEDSKLLPTGRNGTTGTRKQHNPPVGNRTREEKNQSKLLSHTGVNGIRKHHDPPVWELTRQEDFQYFSSLASSASDFSSNNKTLRVEFDDFIYAHEWESPVVIEEYKLLFYSTPKVACTVFRKLFRRMMGFTDWHRSGWQVYDPKLSGISTLRRFPLEKATEIVTSNDWTRAIFVREPKERLLSAFLDKAKGVYYDNDKTKFDGVAGGYIWKWCCPERQYSKSCLHKAQSFEGFVNLTNTCHDPHWNPQSYRMEPKFWSTVNFVGLLENVYNDTHNLLERLGAWEQHGKTGWGKNGNEEIFATRSDVNHARHAKSRHSEYFTPELKRKVDEMYAVDYINPVLAPLYVRGSNQSTLEFK